MGILVLVAIQVLPDPTRDTCFVEGVLPAAVPRDDVAQVGLHVLERIPAEDHLEDVVLHLPGDLRRIAPPDLKPDDVDLVDILALLPDQVPGVALLLAGLEETAVDLL